MARRLLGLESLLLLIFLLFPTISFTQLSAKSAVAITPSRVSLSGSSPSLTPTWNGTYAINQTLTRNTTHYYKPLYEAHYNSTPRFQNVTRKTANPLVIALQPAAGQAISARSVLMKRDLPTGTCAPGTPCINGACCSNVSHSCHDRGSTTSNFVRLAFVVIPQISVVRVFVFQIAMPKQSVVNMEL
jgi:hypothetical protein